MGSIFLEKVGLYLFWYRDGAVGDKQEYKDNDQIERCFYHVKAGFDGDDLTLGGGELMP